MKVTEKSVREDLAALYRLMHHMGISHRIYNHHSARVPDDPDVILINSFGLLQDEIRASNLIKVGREDAESNQAASVIHWGIYDAREDVNCIVHHHSAATVAMSSLDCGLLPMSQGAMQFFNRIGYHVYEGMTFNLDECPRLAASLGPHRAMFLKNHGALICARSVAEAYVLTDDLEKACISQLLAMSGGANIVLPNNEVCERTARQFENMPQPRGEALDWPAALRLLERLNINYHD